MTHAVRFLHAAAELLAISLFTYGVFSFAIAVGG